MTGPTGVAEKRDPAGGPSPDAVEVTFERPFAVSRYPVTFQEWDVCAAAGECRNDVDDEGWGHVLRPVIHASFEDARAYIAWLSKTTRKPYRLLSEAEYDYVNRAGTTTRFWWGDDVGSGHANCKGCGDLAHERTIVPVGLQTLPVGMFPPNGFGLYDTEGNAVSWTLDCWNPSIAGQRHDGRANQDGDCTQRVLRGGAWKSGPNLLESSYRGKYVASQQLNITGFRVARDLP